ncbi:MAG: hypothetical protein E6F97_11130 [Actinobacteria bacterium]|nr:MAG: hypothetical protein E6F97_11130 [Actinomycetota bacterium]
MNTDAAPRNWTLWDHLVLEHGRDAAVERLREGRPLLDLLGRDQPALGDQLLEERRRGELPPVGEPLLAQEAQDAAVGREDAAVRVAKGPRLETRERARRVRHVARRQLGELSELSSSGLPM